MCERRLTRVSWWKQSQMPGSRGLSTDVCVPMSKLTDVIVETQEDLRNSKLFGTIVGCVLLACHCCCRISMASNLMCCMRSPTFTDTSAMATST